jgi:hypothetical protein
MAQCVRVYFLEPGPQCRTPDDAEECLMIQGAINLRAVGIRGANEL